LCKHGNAAGAVAYGAVAGKGSAACYSGINNFHQCAFPGIKVGVDFGHRGCARRYSVASADEYSIVERYVVELQEFVELADFLLGNDYVDLVAQVERVFCVEAHHDACRAVLDVQVAVVQVFGSAVGNYRAPDFAVGRSAGSSACENAAHIADVHHGFGAGAGAAAGTAHLGGIFIAQG